MRMEQHRHVRPADCAYESVEPGRVIGMAVAAHDGLDRCRVDLKSAHVVRHAVGAGTRVEQEPVLAAALRHRHEGREPVLGDERFGYLAVCHQRCRAGRAPAAHCGAPRGALVGHEDIGDVVDERSHHDGLDRLEPDRYGRLHIKKDIGRRDHRQAVIGAHPVIVGAPCLSGLAKITKSANVRREAFMRVSGPGGYWISDDPALLDIARVHQWMSQEAYWAKGRAPVVTARAIEHSLSVGLYAPDGTQAGYARFVTDRATFAWLCDVFVDPAHRGQGLGSFLVAQAVGHPDVAEIRQLLMAEPGRTIYRRLGYGDLLRPERWMERPGS